MDRDFLFWARSKNHQNPEIPGIGIFNFGLDRKITKSRKITKIFIPGIFIFGIGIFISGIRDFLSSGSGFSESRDVYPRDSRFFNFGIFICGIWDFYLRNRDCLSPGTGFFVGCDIPTKKLKKKETERGG